MADLFQRLLRKTRVPASNDLKTYLRTLFLDGANREAGIFSRVHVRADDTVSGFLGVLPVEMEYQGRRLIAANCGTFACDDRDSDPFAGARLLRDVLSGPQDLSFSETSNDVSTDMWRTMRATVLGPYSLEWLRVIKPTAFALEAVAGKIPPARLLSPLARLTDAVLCRRGDKQAWSHYTPLAGKADAFESVPADNGAFSALCLDLLAPFALRPAWDGPKLEARLSHAQ